MATTMKDRELCRSKFGSRTAPQLRADAARVATLSPRRSAWFEQVADELVARGHETLEAVSDVEFDEITAER